MTASDSREDQSAQGQTTHDAEDDVRNRDIKIYRRHRASRRRENLGLRFRLPARRRHVGRHALYNGKWAFLDAHMDRLFAGLKAAGIELSMDRAQVLDALNRTADANGMTGDAHCRLMVTRGIKQSRSSIRRCPLRPTVVIIVEHSRPAAGLQSRGIRLATVPQVRGLPMSQDAKYNSHSKLVRPRLPASRRGRCGRGPDARPPRLRQHDECLQIVRKGERRPATTA